MTDNEANELRLIANDIMYRLWAAGQRDQLHILHKYAEVSIEDIDNNAKKQSTPNNSDVPIPAHSTSTKRNNGTDND